MRSSQPVPGNPWPHDMVLTIADSARGLFELLWVREAWDLFPPGDVPPPAAGTPEPIRTVQALRRDKGRWEHAWTELWTAVLEHAGRPEDPGMFESLQSSPPGSVERRHLLEESRGPSWRDRFGGAAFDDRYQRWVSGLIDRSLHEHRLPIEQHPERRSLDAVVPAWERGLTTVVVVPCTGDYTRTIGSSTLCVARATRLDPDQYRRALTSFGR